MAHKIYDNFYLSNEVEDQFNSHLDLQQFCTVDNSLVGTAGMKRKINVYKATAGTEKLKMGEGNTKSIEVSFTPEEYEIQLAQNKFQYYDEQEMTDPMLVPVGTRHMGTDMFNTVNGDVYGEFKKATMVVPTAKIDFAAFVDAVANLNIESTDNQPEKVAPQTFAFVHPGDTAELRKKSPSTRRVWIEIDTVMTMSITAFESWIVNMLAEAIARKVEDLLINGTGSSQPKGIENANTWGATNSVTVAKTGALTAANVQTLIGLLPSGYDRNGKFVMNKKTLFTDFMPLQDNSKNHIVTVQNNAYFVYGYPVLLSDYVADHEAFLGDFKKVCANLAENIGVKSAYDIDTNSYKYSGIAIFDCAPAIGEAIVKLVKATT